MIRHAAQTVQSPDVNLKHVDLRPPQILQRRPQSSKDLAPGRQRPVGVGGRYVSSECALVGGVYGVEEELFREDETDDPGLLQEMMTFSFTGWGDPVVKVPGVFPLEDPRPGARRRSDGAKVEGQAGFVGVPVDLGLVVGYNWGGSRRSF